jgi:hypothetical protein
MHDQDNRTQPKNQMKREDRQGSERADIVRRVANFKAHQARLQQEREEYYHSVRARIDRVLDIRRPANGVGRSG